VLATAIVLAVAARAQSSPPAPPNVLVYVIDTLRADHLGCYGYRRPTSPRIDAFARSGIVFTRAVAQSSWTLPSIGSILTGRTPPQHGAVSPEHGLRLRVPTLAELLRAHGYTTAAFVTNYLGSDVFGLGRGFSTFRFYREQGSRRAAVYLRSDALFRRVRRWLARAPREPFFLYVHATDPHFPYDPPRRFARPFVSRAAEGERARVLAEGRPLHNGREEWGTRPAPVDARTVGLLGDLYDGEIRMADEYFGALLALLAERGLLERTLVVLTSDHGEEFGEHGGIAHGQTLHGEVLNVPLVVRLPGGVRGGSRVERLAQHADIVPTVLDAAGLPPLAASEGQALLSASRLDEVHASLRLGGFVQDALVSERWKVIRDRARARGRRFALYLTDDDPGEQHDRAADDPALVARVRARLQALGEAGGPGPEVAEQKLERLRALGYVTD
jgi:arylsulfatase A-like enzyme